MLIGVQFSVKTFGALLRENIKILNSSDPKPVGTYVVDHVEIARQTSFSQGSAFKAIVPASSGPFPIATYAVAFHQDIVIHMAALSDLIQHGTSASGTTDKSPTVTFDLIFEVANAQSQIVLTYQGVSDPSLDPTLRQLLTPQYLPLDLASLVGALGTGGIPAHAGAALTHDGNVIELRLELSADGSSSQLLLWEDLYTAQSSTQMRDFTGGNDWAVWLDIDSVEKSLQSKVKSGIEADGSFRLDSSIDLSWQPGTPPRLVLKFNGDAINACTCLTSKIDINADVTVTMSFSIDSGQIRYDVNVNHSSNQLQLTCCELTAALFWPILGKMLLDQKKIKLSDYINGILATPIGVFIAAVIQANGPVPLHTDSYPGVCVKDDDNNFHCLIPFPSGAQSPQVCATPSIEERVPNQLYGLGADLLLSGELVITGSDPIRALSQATLNCSFSDFEWRFPTANCSGEDGRLSMSATISLSGSGDLPLIVWSVDAIGATAGSYQPWITITYSYCPFLAVVHVDVPYGQTVAGTAQILVRTTGGARVITLTPARALTEANFIAHSQAMKQWRLEHCFTKLDPWYRDFERYNPHWGVDPANYGRPGLERQTHVWEVIVAGAIPGDRIALTDGSGKELAVSQVNQQGIAKLGVAIRQGGTPGAAAGNEVSVQRLRQGAKSGMAAAPGIQVLIQQTLIVEAAQLLAGRRPFAVALESRNGRPVLVAAFEGGVNTYDISNAARPWLIQQSMARMNGARRSSRNRMVGWDAHGVTEWTGHSSRRVLEMPGVYAVYEGVSGKHIVHAPEEVVTVESSWEVIGRSAPDQAREPLTATDSPLPSFTMHSRFGLAAHIEGDRISLGTIAGIRKL